MHRLLGGLKKGFTLLFLHFFLCVLSKLQSQDSKKNNIGHPLTKVHFKDYFYICKNINLFSLSSCLQVVYLKFRVNFIAGLHYFLHVYHFQINIIRKN